MKPRDGMTLAGLCRVGVLAHRFGCRRAGDAISAKERRWAGTPTLRGERRGFTLVEVMATLVVLGIVMPGIIAALTLATRSADIAKHRNIAALLAQQQLSQILIGNEWQNGNESGNFGTQFPEYSWSSNVYAWPEDTTGAGLQEIDLTVAWTEFGHPQSLTVSTVAYLRVQTQE